MKTFDGFPSGRVEFTAVPNAFFSALLNDINDLDELKTTLHFIAVIYRQKGYPRFLRYRELLENTVLIQALRGSEQALREALDKAVSRGTVLALTVVDGAEENIYFLNDAPGRQALAKIRSGGLKLPGVKVAPPQVPVQAEELPDVFTLYEQNIGMLTPMIADELRDAEKLYPPDWIRDAIRESALHNKRNIKYILKILENWSVEGRFDGPYQRDTQETGPGKYFKGKYGHMVRR
jgi:DNA replication protein